MDTININNLKVFAYHGVFPDETKNGQNFYVSASLQVDASVPATDDDLSKAVDYGKVCFFIHDFMTQNTYKLIETLAHNMANALLISFPDIHAVELEVKKPEAPVELSFECISVKVSRKYHTAYLSIGSNLGNRKGQLNFAIDSLGMKPDTAVVKYSSFIETAPVGYLDQPDFLNAVVCIRTILSPEELLHRIHSIENDAKREREIHWGPRTLDIDIVLYDDIVYESPTLNIPHLHMHERAFVLEPLCEIAPGVVHPVLGKTAAMMKDDLFSQSHISQDPQYP